MKFKSGIWHRVYECNHCGEIALLDHNMRPCWGCGKENEDPEPIERVGRSRTELTLRRGYQTWWEVRD